MKTPEPRKLKSGTWFVQLRLTSEDGEKISVPVSAYSKKECARQAELIKAEHRAGVKKLSALPDMTLEQAAREYIRKRSESLSPSTKRGYEMIIRNRFRGAMGSQLSRKTDWQQICNREAARTGCSAKTLKNAWCFISAVLRDAGLPVPDVSLPRVMPAERPWLDPDEILKFVAVVSGSPVELPALLALHSLRRSEICALSWEKVDLKKGVIRVEGAAVYDENGRLVQKPTNKNASSRRSIPIMMPQLARALAAVPDKSGLVVSCHPSTMYTQINRACRSAGLPEVGVHGLRHSFASLAYHLGFSEMETMRFGGWSNTQTMHRIYTHLSDKDKLRAVNKMAVFYSEAEKSANKSAN